MFRLDSCLCAVLCSAVHRKPVYIKAQTSLQHELFLLKHKPNLTTDPLFFFLFAMEYDIDFLSCSILCSLFSFPI